MIAFAIALPLFVAGPTSAQSEDAEPLQQELFVDVVDVEVVNIDVWVTEKDGTPVTGLTDDDFVVLRDGEPVEVSNFYAVTDTSAAERRVAEFIDSAPTPDETPAEPAATIPEHHRLWLIVFVDNYNIDPTERNRVLPSLQVFLKRTLRGGDRAMLVSYTRSLEVHQPFTEDPRLIADALDEIRDLAGLDVIRARERRETLERIDETEDSDNALLYARQYAEEQMNGVGYTVNALERLIESLAGLPGRKALVHVSSGIPMVAGEEMFHAVGEKFGTSRAYSEIPRHDTTRDFERVNRYANANRVTFYTVDAGGLQGLEFGGAEHGGFVNPKLRRTLDSVVPENLQSPLRLMALETGGKAIVNRNDILPALDDAASDFRSFYSLGITSTGASTGRYHEIEVKLREPRPGAKLRHRTGYRSKNTDTRVREGLRSALLYAHEDNPLGVRITYGEPTRHGTQGNYLLPVQLQVPLKDTVLLPTGNGKHEVRLRLYVGVAGADGEMSSIDSAPMGLRLADEHVEAAKGEALVHTHKLLVTPGRKKIGIAVLDVFGQATSIVTGFAQIGEQKQTAEQPAFKF